MLRNHWYIACRSKQLKKQRPLARTIVGEHIALFRGHDGEPGALIDRCLHRNMALSLGQVDEHGLRCSYHGWTWGRDGACQRIPASCEGADACAKLRVKSYPVVEKQGFVWVFVGDKPPESEPIDFPMFDEARWNHWVMEREFDGAAFHCVENFLDVPHTNHVHKGWFRSAESDEVVIELTSGEDWIQAEFLNEKPMESIIGKLLIPKDAEMIHTDRFQLPFVTRVDYRMGETRQYIVMSQCTPIDESRTRTFTYMAYRFDGFSPLVRLFYEPLSNLILNQDIDIIRRQTESLAKTGPAKFLYHETDAIAAGIRDLIAGKTLAGRPAERRTLIV